MSADTYSSWLLLGDPAQEMFVVASEATIIEIAKALARQAAREDHEATTKH
jgi:hypothetical protein